MLKLCLIIGLSAGLAMGNPTPQEDDYYDDENETVCETTEDSKDPGKVCVLPFTHDDITHFGCPLDPVDKSKRWCSTKTDENGTHIGGEGAWGYCTEECPPEISPDEFSVGERAKTDTQTKTCDVKACNGFTLITKVYDKEVTFGECQFPAGINGSNDDYFCFVNDDSACTNKVPYGPPEDGRFFSTEPCETAILPRFFSGLSLNFKFGNSGSSNRNSGGWGSSNRNSGGWGSSNRNSGGWGSSRNDGWGSSGGRRGGSSGGGSSFNIGFSLFGK